MLGSFAGGIVGALGLGGGVVFNPLLMGLGVPPQVATATAMYMIMFGTLSSSLIFLTMGSLNVPFALWIGLWSVVGIILCLKVVSKIIESTGRPSVIVIVLALILGASAVMIPVFNGIALAEKAQQGQDIYAFGQMC